MKVKLYMLNKLLQVYENKILNERTKRNLGWLGWSYIILCGISLIMFLIFEILHLYLLSVISVVMIVLWSIAFSVISNKVIRLNEQDLKQFKTEMVDKFADILKQADLNSKEAIEVIICQCKEYEDTKSKIFFGDCFKSVFTMLIYPIITAVSTIIVKNMSDQYMTEWSVFIIGMIIIIYVIVAVIYPMVSDYINKYKRIAKMMRHDLEYILAMDKWITSK